MYTVAITPNVAFLPHFYPPQFKAVCTQDIGIPQIYPFHQLFKHYLPHFYPIIYPILPHFNPNFTPLSKVASALAVLSRGESDPDMSTSESHLVHGGHHGAAALVGHHGAVVGHHGVVGHHAAAVVAPHHGVGVPAAVHGVGVAHHGAAVAPYRPPPPPYSPAYNAYGE